MLETSVEEIDAAGSCLSTHPTVSLDKFHLLVHEAAKARRESYSSANPLSLGGGGVGGRNTGLQTPLGWLTTKLTGVAAR